MKRRVTVGFVMLTNINFMLFLPKISKNCLLASKSINILILFLENNRIENSPFFLWVERKSVILLGESILFNVNTQKQTLMKHFKTWTWALVAMVMMVCETASAQYYSRPTGSSSSTIRYNHNDETQLNIVEVQFALDHFGNDVKSVGMQTLTYSYIHGFGLSSKAPMFLEVGAGMEYSWCDNKIGTMHNLAFKIPVRFSYDIPTAGSISFVPYTGPFIRLNQTGDWDDDLINGSIYKGSDMTDEHGKFNRFQVGWQLGCRVRFTRSFHAGLEANFDISKWSGRIDGKRWNVGLGIGLDF